MKPLARVVCGPRSTAHTQARCIMRQPVVTLWTRPGVWCCRARSHARAQRTRRVPLEAASLLLTPPAPAASPWCARQTAATAPPTAAGPRSVFHHTDCIKGLGLAESAALAALAYSVGTGCTCTELLPQLTNTRSQPGHRFGRPQTPERAAELVPAHRPLTCTSYYDGKNPTHGDGHRTHLLNAPARRALKNFRPPLRNKMADEGACVACEKGWRRRHLLKVPQNTQRIAASARVGDVHHGRA